MKKLILTVIAVALLFTSCREVPRASSILSDFLYSYPMGGNVYTSDASEGEVGYASEELLSRLFDYEGELSVGYAFLLAARPERGGECGVFVTDDALERERITEMCRRRVALVSDGGGVVIRSGRVVAYLTSSDERAERLLRKIISRYT